MLGTAFLHYHAVIQLQDVRSQFREAAGDEVEVVFNGAGTRWPEELTNLSHPANGLYNSVREAVKGASCGCAAVFGATKGVEACGVPLLTDKKLAGTAGLSNIRHYLANDWKTLVF